MREFDYQKLADKSWDSEILGLVAQIHEYKGRQELFIRQKPVELEKLVEIAKVQSTEASNEIEGIRTSVTRLKQLCAEKTTPKNRDEYEIAGYRDVLNTIHENYEYIPINKNYILQLHRDLYKYSEKGIGGEFKRSQNHIIATDASGKSMILFALLPPYETAPAVEAICDSYNRVRDNQAVDALILISAFIHDFLCFHPFSDGNGRMSRLLTTLLLYRSGYFIGRYISLESKIAKGKGRYYDALSACQDGWSEGKDDPTTFVKYLLGTILAAYRDFEDRVDLAGGKLTSLEAVRRAVGMRIGKFTKNDILEQCPGIGRASVENALKKLVESGEIMRMGSARATCYVRADSVK
ncbi:MAG: Fic family protein [Eubacteriaceae bacterium]|nr:Fic family protein [Eubacteriaceae bacterium]